MRTNLKLQLTTVVVTIATTAAFIVHKILVLSPLSINNQVFLSIMGRIVSRV